MIKILIALIIIPFSMFSQYKRTMEIEEYRTQLLESDSLRNGTYENLIDAYKNRGNVFLLKLDGYGLSSVPDIVLSFENLTILSIKNRTEIIDTMDTSSNKHYMDYREGRYDVVIQKQNWITNLPCRLGGLKNLKFIDVRGLNISKSELVRLKQCMPNVFIIVE